MAGRGSRVHVQTASKIQPNKEYTEVDEIVRVRAYFPSNSLASREGVNDWRATRETHNRWWEKTTCKSA
jgi:hypothetical protein